MISIPPLPIRPELFVAGCAVVAILGLKLINDGRRQILGKSKQRAGVWRRVLVLLGLPDTARASARKVGTTQLLVGLSLTLGSVAIVCLNRPLGDPQVLRTSWHQSLRPTLEEAGQSLPSEVSLGPLTKHPMVQYIQLPERAPQSLPIVANPGSLRNLSATAGTSTQPLSGNYELAPEGGILVGFRATSGGDQSFREAPLTSVQAIYQVEDRYVPGTRFGNRGPIEYQSLAPAGWALCALEASCGRGLRGLRCYFAPLDTLGSSPPAQRGAWLGFPTDGVPRVIDVDGPAVGCCITEPNLSITLCYRDERRTIPVASIASRTSGRRKSRKAHWKP